MGISKNSLQARINNISKERGVHANIILKAFFFDAFIERLSKSEYRDNFIFKGGFFLSKTLGIDMRSTMDIDFLLRKVHMDEQSVTSMIKDICSNHVDDSIKFTFSKITPIREDDLYGGFNIQLNAKLENIREIVSIDLATGDPITPNEILFPYRTILGKEINNLKSYNMETVIAEKLQTVLARNVSNSRAKDFYDIYIIFSIKNNKVSKTTLKESFMATCSHRKTFFTIKEAEKIIEDIKISQSMKNTWMAYCRRNIFAKDIIFEDVISVIEQIICIVF